MPLVFSLHPLRFSGDSITTSRRTGGVPLAQSLRAGSQLWQREGRRGRPSPGPGGAPGLQRQAGRRTSTSGQTGGRDNGHKGRWCLEALVRQSWDPAMIIQKCVNYFLCEIGLDRQNDPWNWTVQRHKYL